MPRSAKRARLDERQDRRVRSDLGIELRADPPERSRAARCASRSPLPSSSMSPVIAARPGPSPGSARSADGQQREEADERHGVVLDGQDPQAVRQAAAVESSGKRKRGSGPSDGQARAIDGHHATDTGCEPASASAGWPARDDAEHDARLGPQPRARCTLHRFWRDLPIARQVRRRSTRDRRGRRCRRSADRLCRRTRRRSAAGR